MPLRKRQEIQAVLRKKIKQRLRNYKQQMTAGVQIGFREAKASGNGSPTRAPAVICGTIIKKEGVVVVELDQFKYTLNNYAQPLTELRDSL